LETLVFELVEWPQNDTTDAARRTDFADAARLVNQVKDLQGKPDDFPVMSISVGTWSPWL